MTDAYILFHSRAFRIGQSRDVKVYRFISEATVEENIYLRQVYKQVTEGEGRSERGEKGERERVSCSSFPQDIHNYIFWYSLPSNWPTWRWRAVKSGGISQLWQETRSNKGSSLAIPISLRCTDQAPTSHWIS